MTARISLVFTLLCAVFTFSAHAQETVHFEESWGEPGLTLVSQSPDEVLLNFSIPSIALTEVTAGDERMTKILLPGAQLGNDAGAPDLPGISRFIAVPNGAGVTVEILASRSRVFNDIDIAPALPIPKETENPAPVYTRDPAIYELDQNFPAHPVRTLHLKARWQAARFRKSSFPRSNGARPKLWRAGWSRDSRWWM